MLEFKACPKCHGDVYTVEDIYGDYARCLQCGYVVDPVKTSAVDDAAAPAEEAPGGRGGGGRKVA